MLVAIQCDVQVSYIQVKSSLIRECGLSNIATQYRWWEDSDHSVIAFLSPE